MMWKKYVSIFVVMWVGLFVISGCNKEKLVLGPENVSNIPKSAKAPENLMTPQSIQSQNTILPSSVPSNPSDKMEKIEDKEGSVTNKTNIGQQKIVCIDPGHQSKGNSGKEPIAPSSNIRKEKVSGRATGIVTNTPEYKINLIVANKLRTVLENKGYKVIMTRQTNNINISNVERAKIANDAKADLCIRIHADSSTRESINGISMLIPSNKYIKDKEMLAKSKNAAEIILKKVIKKTEAESRGVVERGDMTGFNWSTVPTALIEMGFLSNEEEDKLLSTTSYQNKIVDGISSGIVEYFKK